LQASNAFLSAGAASPDEFYDLYTMDLEAEGQWARARRRFMRHRLAVASLVILTIVFAAGFLSSWLAPYGYEQVNINAHNPSVAASNQRVYVTYGVGLPGEPQSVHTGALDRSLRPLWRGGVGPVDPKADRFWPASALDVTTGRLSVCFYDTGGDPGRSHAWYSCTSSRDGRRWAKPVRAARDFASSDVLWEDARVYAFGDAIGYGGSTGVAAAGGTVYPLWIDTSDLGGRKQEVFGATLP